MLYLPRPTVSALLASLRLAEFPPRPSVPISPHRQPCPAPEVPWSAGHFALPCCCSNFLLHKAVRGLVHMHMNPAHRSPPGYPAMASQSSREEGKPLIEVRRLLSALSLTGSPNASSCWPCSPTLATGPLHMLLLRAGSSSLPLDKEILLMLVPAHFARKALPGLPGLSSLLSSLCFRSGACASSWPHES